MAVTTNTYTGNGSTTNYSFTFPYLDVTDIKVSVNGVLTTAYTLANATTVSFNTAPANGATIAIYRDTGNEELKATFYSGSTIRAQDLNEDFLQSFYIAQETQNKSDVAVSTANTALTNANSAVSTANTASTNASAAVTTANTASANASAAVTTANTAATNASAAVSTANTANTNASAAVTTANAASTSASNAVATANAANTNANQANANSSAAVSTANTASTNASAAVNTANTAATNASNAVTTANTAASNAATALSTANTASTNASAAVSTANTASSNASAAVSTANTAATNAATALSTANTAATNASTALSTANTANTNANTAIFDSNSALLAANDAATDAAAAVSTANAAAAAVASAILYTIVANVAAIPASPANNTAIEVTDSTGIQSFTPLSGIPAVFVGSSGLSVRIVYQSAGSTWVWIQYFPNDPETRYFKLSGGTITGPITVPQGTVSSPGIKFSGTGNDNTGVYSPGIDELGLVTNGVARLTIDSSGNVAVGGGLTKGGNNVVTIGDTGTVTSTMIADGTIVDGDINANANIADTKLATISTAGKVNGTALTGTIPGAVLGNSSTFVGTTSVALNRSSANQALTGISSVALPGSTSGIVTVQPTAVAGTTTITLPATTGTVITTGDNGTVNSTMIADGTIVDGDINASAGITHSKLASIPAGQILLGNASNVPTATAISGDATLSNSGTLTLANSGAAAGTYRSVTIDAKGRVTAGTNPTTFSGYGISDTSANLAAAITDETGTGALVFANSPALTGIPTTPTATAGTNTTQIASTAFVTTAVANNQAFTSGTALVFAQTNAPTGWTKSTTHNDKALRVVSGTASSGGTTAFTTVFASRTPTGTVGSTTLTESQIPSHTHTYSGASTLTSGLARASLTNTGQASTPSTNATGGGGSHNHSFTGDAMNFSVQYVDVIIATKD